MPTSIKYVIRYKRTNANNKDEHEKNNAFSPDDAGGNGFAGR